MGLILKTVNFEVRTRAVTLPRSVSTAEELYSAATDLLTTETRACSPSPLRLRLMGIYIGPLREYKLSISCSILCVCVCVCVCRCEDLLSTEEGRFVREWEEEEEQTGDTGCVCPATTDSHACHAITHQD